MINKPFINPFLLNLYSSGIVIENNTESFITFNKDYIISFDRKNASIWFTEEYKYLCIINIKNNLNINILDITVTELDIFILLDNIYNFLQYDMNEIYIPFKYKYIFNLLFYRDINDFNKIYFIISDNNIERLKIEFDESSLLSFVDSLYFSFLVDIDNNTENDGNNVTSNLLKLKNNNL